MRGESKSTLTTHPGWMPNSLIWEIIMKKLFMGLSILGLLNVPAWANNLENNQAKIEHVSNETEALKKQLIQLQQEVDNLNKKKSFVHQAKHDVVKPKAKVHQKAAPISSSIPGVSHIIQDDGTDMDRLVETYVESLPLDWDNPGQSFVSIGPYVNVPIKFSGGNLIINDPKINTDVALLKLKKASHEGMVARGVPEEEHHSHLLLSGNVEGQGQFTQYGQQSGTGSAGGNGSSTNIDLSSAELDGFLLTPSPWVSGFFSFSYDNGFNPTVTNSRVLDSRIFLNTGFIILGDFAKSPYYATLGQMFVPFGTYSSVFISSPLTKKFARTKARAVLAGYQGQTPSAFYTSLYAFRGDSHASSSSRVNNGGVNMGYRFDWHDPDINGDIGLGWLANIADSTGMQFTNAQPEFNGFGGPAPYGNEQIVHRVPAVNVRGRLSYKEHFDLIAEYVGVTTSFNPNDLSFNATGAKPWGFNTEAAYTFPIKDYVVSWGVGYSQAKEALALGLPERRFGTVLNTSIWHNTLQSIELRHDINYSSATYASGSGVTKPVTGLGTSDNVITVQFDLFF